MYTYFHIYKLRVQQELLFEGPFGRTSILFGQRLVPQLAQCGPRWSSCAWGWIPVLGRKTLQRPRGVVTEKIHPPS